LIRKVISPVILGANIRLGSTKTPEKKMIGYINMIEVCRIAE